MLDNCGLISNAIGLMKWIDYHFVSFEKLEPDFEEVVPN